MTRRLCSTAATALLALTAFAAFAGCETSPYPPNWQDYPPPDEVPPEPSGFPVCNELPACNTAITVNAAGPALMITDPAVLAKVPLDKVIQKLIDDGGAQFKPADMMQRLFDTMNTTADGKYQDVYHCDSAEQPALMFGNGDSFSCPRAEGALASSTGFFQAGNPDHFFPVAIVNRFDLTPVDGMTCGQYRIIYAKESGLTDPQNRVFLIFEAALQNALPGCVDACRPVAEFWNGLEGLGSAQIADQIDQFFFTGVSGFGPAVTPENFGFGQKDDGGYGHEHGQIRVSMHMQDPWNMREMRLDFSPTTGEPVFAPATVKNNPAAELFDPQSPEWASQLLRDTFMGMDIQTLASDKVAAIQMHTMPELNGVESELAGEKANDYATAATASGDMSFIEMMDSQIVSQGLNQNCPQDDPLDAIAILKRATAQSCAGCHAPSELIGETRSIGCGLTWPDSIGQVHVTEQSELSPALKDVFLPRRAEVMQTFLQSCDIDAIFGNLQSGGMGGGLEKKILPQRRTLGGSSTH